MTASAASPSGLLVVRPKGGLANRIRVVASFRALAACTRRGFAVCWTPGPGFSDETMDELFDLEVDTISVAQYRAHRDAGLVLDDVLRTGVNAGHRWPDRTSAASLLDAGSWPVVTYHGCYAVDQALGPSVEATLPGIGPATAHDLRGWRPSAALQPAVRTIVERFGPATFGVHIRRGDALVNPWVGPRVRRSTDAAFERRMDEVFADEPHTTFFLATDDAATAARFTARYGERVLVHDAKEFVPSLHGRAKDNQRDAVVDLFALAATTRVLGTAGSSFGTIAAVIGGVPFETIVDRSLRSWLRSRLVPDYLRVHLRRLSRRARRAGAKVLPRS